MSNLDFLFSPNYELVRGGQVIGLIRWINTEQPWHLGRFQPTSAYANCSELFRSELTLLEAEEMEKWDEIWAEIDRPGLILRSVGKGEEITSLVIHIEKQETEARWRY